MAALTTPDAVISAADVRHLGEYHDVIALIDAAGFSVKRDYPAGTPLAAASTRSGKNNYTVMIHFVANPPTARSGIQRVVLHARLRGSWEEEHRGRWNHGAVRRHDGAWLFGSVVRMKRRISRALRGYANMCGSRYPPNWTDSVVRRRESASPLEGDR